MGNTNGFWSRLGWARRADTSEVQAEAQGRLGPEAQVPEASAAKGARLGSFSLLRCIAQGGQGELYLATDVGTGLPVAIKTIHLGNSEVACDRFTREATAAAHLQHPDIVRSYAAGTDGQGEARKGWIAMEWVSGEDLGQALSGPCRPDTVSLLLLAARVSAALAYAHRKGVLHLDIKPGNILLQRRSGLVKLTDFGCAHLANAEASRSGVMVGTPAYMAPEQLAGAAVDQRADFYALGVLLFQGLTGRLPFESPSMGELLSQIAHRPAPSLSALRPDLPPSLGLLMASLLAKPVAERPADGDELARELCKMALASGLVCPEDAATTRHNG